MRKLLDLFMYLIVVVIITTASIALINTSKENNPYTPHGNKSYFIHTREVWPKQ